MSLSLLQGYSSAEEEDDQQPQHPYLQNSDEDEEDDDEDEDEQNDKEGAIHDKSFIKLPIPSSGSGSSGLPSVLDLFSEVRLSLSFFGIILLLLLLSFFTVMNNESSEYY